MNDLTHLADLIRIRNVVNSSVSRIIGMPAETGNIAEFVAAAIFDFQFAPPNSAIIDGVFTDQSPLAGKTANVKYRSTAHRRLNLANSADLALHPDFYLALRGPATAKDPTSETTLPFLIDSVYLFASAVLIPKIVAEGKPNIGPNVGVNHWKCARIYPEQVNQTLILNDEQRAALRLFAPQPA